MTDALHIETLGHGPRVVLVHGFTQTGRSWGTVADGLAAAHEVVLVDAPGHAGSDAVRADLSQGAELLADAGGAATYAGYSMGARLCLHLALARPDLVASLVLVSGTAGIEDDDERASRKLADDATADAIERDGLDAFLAQWLAQPMFSGLAGLPGAAADRADRRRNTAAGLASSLRLTGVGTQASLWPRLGELAMPVTVVAGEHDAKFVLLAERMAERIPRATLRIVPRAGHAVPLERPHQALAVVAGALGSA